MSAAETIAARRLPESYEALVWNDIAIGKQQFLAASISWKFSLPAWRRSSTAAKASVIEMSIVIVTVSLVA